MLKKRHLITFNMFLNRDPILVNRILLRLTKESRINPEHIEKAQCYRMPSGKMVKISKYISYRTNYKIWDPFG